MADKGDNDRAIADYDQALKLDPKLAVAYNNRGIARLSKGDSDRAIADYDMALKLDPKFAYAYKGRGNAWKAKGDDDRAIADYDQAIAIDPNYSHAYKDRGDAWLDKGDNKHAIADYDKAIAIDPKYSKAYFFRGISRFFGGDAAKSQADFGEFVDILPHETHGAIWFALSKKANNLTIDAPATEQNLDMNKWPAPVLRFIEGKLQSTEVMAAASDPKERCEASLYAGVFDQLSKHEADAIQNYRAAYEGCFEDLHKEIARLGLKQLGVAP